MKQVVIYGLISGFALLLGAILGLRYKFSRKVIAAFMAFGSGVLICALTFGLMEQAFKHGGFDAVVIGFTLGGLCFIAGDYLLHLKGGRRHRRKPLMAAKNTPEGGKEIVLGALLDGIPESVALGIALYFGPGGLLLLVAIILSNFPEGITSVEGLLKEKFKRAQIYLMWTIVALICATTTVVSYLYLHNIGANNIGILEAFAAGAILAMLADSMIPEAFEDGGFVISLFTILGFLASFLLSRISGF